MKLRSLVVAVLLAASPRPIAGQEIRHGLPVSTPAQEGITDTAALRTLLDRVKATNTSSLVVLKNGKIVLEWYDGPRAPAELWLMTPAVLSMVVGQLIDAGKLSLEQPVHTWYPEWNQGRAAKVTVHHLLSQSSGIGRDVSLAYAGSEPNFIRAALFAGHPHEPGSAHRYNNNELNLLAGVASKAAGMPIDEYARSSLFAPLGITDVNWVRASGVPIGMQGLYLHAVDLAKLGQLMLNRGTWDGKRLLSEEWVERSTQPGTPHEITSGLLWGLYYPRLGLRYIFDQPLVDRWRAAGVPAEYVDLFTEFVGKTVRPLDYNNAFSAKVPNAARRAQIIDAFADAGVARYRQWAAPKILYRTYGAGQWLIVIPSARLVAVRQLTEDRRDNPNNNLSNFTDLVWDLVSASIALPTPTPPPAR